jgi:hemoglobin-like flavoprotein
MLTNDQKALVQETWKLVQPISSKAAELFYGKLFELDPAIRPLFKADMKEQGVKLMKTIGVAVNSLNDLPTIVPVVQALGQRHVGYGVKPDHYPTVGKALLWTLEQGLGPKATPEVLEAWGAVYRILSSIMIESAQPMVA